MNWRKLLASLSALLLGASFAHVPITPSHQHEYFDHPQLIAPENTTLAGIVAYALKTNPDMLISINQRLQSNTTFREDIAGYLPSLDVTGEDGSERTRNQNTNRVFLNLQRSSYTIALTENVFNGFQTYFNVRADLANIASQASAVKNTSENTALAVAEVYLNVLRAKELVSIAKKNVASYVRTYEIIGKRVKKGLSSESELSQTRGRLALARSDLLNQLKGLADAKSQYLEVVGMEPHKLHTPTADFKKAFKLISKKEAVLQTIRHNPALRSSQYNLNASIEAHKASLHPYYPSINLVASRTRGENINGQTGANDDDSLYVEANFNLFRGGADYARYRKTAYQAQEAFNQLGKIKRQVINNTEIAWNQWDTAIKDLKELRIHMVESDVVLKAFRKQYTLGKRTLLDLLNAEAEYFRASSAYIDGRFNILLNNYRVLSSEGKLVGYFSAPIPEAAEVDVNPYHPNYLTAVHDGKIDVNALPAVPNTSGCCVTKNHHTVCKKPKKAIELSALSPPAKTQVIHLATYKTLPLKKIALRPHNTTPPTKIANIDPPRITIKPAYQTNKKVMLPMPTQASNYQTIKRHQKIPLYTAEQTDKKSHI